MLCDFCLAGTGVPHSRQGREEKEKTAQIRPSPFAFGGAWEDAPPVYNDHRRCPEFPSTVPEAILEFSNVAVYIWALLCFDLFDYFFSLLCCKHVIVDMQLWVSQHNKRRRCVCVFFIIIIYYIEL